MVNQADHIDATNCIMKEQNRQLVVQNLYCDKLHKILFSIEKVVKEKMTCHKLLAIEVGYQLIGENWQKVVEQMRIGDIW